MLERLVLQGFKSFAERTVLELTPGLVGIVGPNGSGKSNLIEALRWVTGARYHELRGGELSRFLFQGTARHPPATRAEVVLELDWKGPSRVARLLERGGSSELRLNGSRISLAALEAFLAGSGLFRGYAIVGQGEVSELLAASPARLLTYVEEAAGLKGVAQALSLSEERLKEAEAELLQRLMALEDERRKVEPKRAQAELARRASALAQRRQLLARSLLWARKQELLRELERVKDDEETLARQRGDLEARLEALRRERQSLSQELAALREQRAAWSQIKGELAREEALKERIEEELARLLEEERRFQELPPPPPVPKPPEELEALRAARRALKARLLEEERRLAQVEKAYQAFLSQLARYQAQEEEARRTLAVREELKAELLARQQALQELKERRAVLAGMAPQVEPKARELEELSARERVLRREVERLRAQIEAGSDLAEGPRRIRQAALEGVYGVVLDLLEIPPGLELAVEQALGPRLQWILCRDEAVVEEGIERLKREGGRATFLPLSLLHPRLPRPFEGPGVLGLLADRVGLRAPEPFRLALFGETYLVEDLPQALVLARRPGRPRLVTLAGELLEVGGAVSGGRLRPGGVSLRVQELRSLQEAEALAKQRAVLSEEVEALRQKWAEWARELRSLEEAEARLQGEIAALSRRIPPPLELPPPPTPVPPPEAGPLEALRQELLALDERLQALSLQEVAWREHRKAEEAYARAQSFLASAKERRAILERELGERRARLEGLTQEEARLRPPSFAPLEEREARQAEEERRLLAELNRVLAQLDERRLQRTRREGLVEAVVGELVQLPEGEIEEGSVRSLQAALERLEEEQRALGPVNYLAEQELAALEQELARAEAALGEVERAAQELREELKTLRGEYARRRDAALEELRGALSRYAELLLGAEVGLDSEGGLRLSLRIRGKPPVPLSLLSTGEKSLGAIAFLLALADLGSGGLPVAILDEVDAALDEHNLERFARFLDEGQKRTQFLVVTHQHRVMEVCPTLFGVTSAQGVSRVYRLDRD